ncbi:MAG: TfoX/Sxy family protein [Deltaproteobacteria bacterium]|jgi:DNA transformation protein|nr:TfoX/Sxy family protein [Deltaproteobacteria bacterium]
MSDITSLNIGKTMEKKLHSVGIHTAEELIDIGSKEAIKRLKMTYPSTCVVILYHLEASIEGLEMKMLPAERKAELKEFFKGALKEITERIRQGQFRKLWLSTRNYCSWAGM